MTEFYERICCAECHAPIEKESNSCIKCGEKCIGKGVYPERHKPQAPKKIFFNGKQASV